ncbi:MAG: protein-L-isoaspartate(D-aspartate) O-methyltransferase [Acidobacteriota bacterium]|nr:protein-L-isoaspartate(D-aspartate) O-methyltransferase [Acidobacteriota bacterium]
MNRVDHRRYERARREMTERLARQGIADPRVLGALGRVPRHLFVDPALAGQAYEDVRLPLGLGQTISQPWTVARLAELVQAPEGSRVLEIGAGSGYQAAVLAEMGLIVFTVERHAELARTAAARLRELGYLRATVKHFDGSYGWAAMGPYRAVVVTAAAPEVPDTLLRQLETGGRLVLPLARDGEDEQRLVVVRKLPGEAFEQEDHGAASFVPLIGRYGYGRDPKGSAVGPSGGAPGRGPGPGAR